MDEIVRAALRKWPSVPACRGWLGLDARGDWYMRDEHTQTRGPFAQAKGSRIEHDKLRAFIERNYEADAGGAWYFQNGPQRVYVELEATPWILGVMPSRSGASGWVVHTHTGRAVGGIDGARLDEQGRLYLTWPGGIGLVRSLDMDTAADAVLAGLWQPEPVQAADLPRLYGYCPSPQGLG